MLKNKVVLITGSARGIGAATTRLAKKYGIHRVEQFHPTALKLRGTSRIVQ